MDNEYYCLKLMKAFGLPGITAIMSLLQGSDTPVEDRETFLKAQVIFWLIGATDGHAKNFSLFLGPGGSYRMTPFYDVLTAGPAATARQIEGKQMKLAMSVGKRRHYRIDQIHGRHFVETAVEAGMSRKRAISVLESVAEQVNGALDTVTDDLPADFPMEIVSAVNGSVRKRLSGLSVATPSD